MRMQYNRGWGVLALSWAFCQPGLAMGQLAPAPATPSSPTVPPAAILMNPYLNPALNPYLNPGAAQQRMSPGNAALYLYSAQAAGGGMGSGRLSGSRPLPAQSQAKAAEMPYASSVPGAGASRYFNPGPVNANGAGRYYNRRNRYFQSNGR